MTTNTDWNNKITASRAIHFQTWLTYGYCMEAVLTGGRGVIITERADGSTGEDLDLATLADAKRMHALLGALVAEWESVTESL